MKEYILSLIEEIVSKKILEYEKLDSASLNENWILKFENGDKLFLKKNNNKSIEEISKKDIIIDHINKKSKVKMKKNMYICYDNIIWSISNYIKGRHYLLNSESDLKEAVKNLNFIHNLYFDYKICNEIKSCNNMCDIRDINGLEELILSKEYKKIDKYIKEIQDINKVLFKLPKVIIHGDYHGKNLIYNKESNELIATLDYDNIDFSSRILDIAYAALLLCRKESGNFNINQKLFYEFHKIYFANEKLLIEEFEIYRYLLYMRLIPKKKYIQSLRKYNYNYVYKYIEWSILALERAQKLDLNFLKGYI